MKLKFKLIGIFFSIVVIMSPAASAFGAREVIKINEIINFLTKNQKPYSEEFKGTSELEILSKMINFFIHKMPKDCEDIKDIQIIYNVILICKRHLEEQEFIEVGLYDKLVEQEKIYVEALNGLKILQINEFLDCGKKPVFSEFSGDSEVEILHKMYLFLDSIKYPYVTERFGIENMKNIIYKMNVRLERLKNRNFNLEELEKWLSGKEEELKLSEIEKFITEENFFLLSEFKTCSGEESIYKMCLFLRNTILKNCKNKEYIEHLYKISLKLKNYLIKTNCLDDFLGFNLKALKLLYCSHVNGFKTREDFSRLIGYWQEASEIYCSIKEMLIKSSDKTDLYKASYEDILSMENYCLRNVFSRQGILCSHSGKNLEALKFFCQSYCLSRDKEPFDMQDKKWKCIPKCVEKVSSDIRELRFSSKNEEAFKMIVDLFDQLIIINYDPAFIDSCKDVILGSIVELFNKGEQLKRENLYKEAYKKYYLALDGAILINDDFYELECRKRIDECMKKLEGTTNLEILELND